MPTTWSVLITDEHGSVLHEQDPDAALSIASVGKLLLLIAVAEMHDDVDLARIMVGRDSVVPVADSGLWQHLTAQQLSLHDLVVLVSSVSDNVATNALLAHVGLERVRACAHAWGVEQTILLDQVRDARDESDVRAGIVAPRLAQGTARELCSLALRLHESPPGSPGGRVAAWLRTNIDLSLVASAFGLDPLAHADASAPVSLWNKTGTDDGVLADVGVLTGSAGSVGYAVVVNADPFDARAMREAMREWGERIWQLAR